jgi:hypothetical protein
MMRRHTSDWQYVATWHPVFAWMLMLFLIWPVILSIFVNYRWLFDLDEAVGSCFDSTLGMLQAGKHVAQEMVAFVQPIVQVGQQAAHEDAARAE